jgi:2-oxoglutarate/2-oxoacid ferredoxin oxidoreductase subunit alpha
MMRGGPGMGNISSSQSDYLQATRGGGHGDYKTIVLAPSSVQELADLVPVAFDLADEYRNPVIILGDGILGQMMEPVSFDNIKPKKNYPKDYILTGAKGRPSRMVRSLLFDTKEEEEHNWKLFRKYQRMEQNEIRYETFLVEDAEIIIIAYGTGARIAKGAIKRLRQENLKVGMIRPITAWPFPMKAIYELAQQVNDFFVFEMSTGQLIEDVKLALNGRGHIHFYGRPGGVIPTPVELSRIVSRHCYQAQRRKKH